MGVRRRRFSADAIRLALINEVIDRLQLEAEPEHRQSLLNSLIREVENFGEPERRLDVVDVYIEQAAYKAHLLELSAPETSRNPNRLKEWARDLTNWREVLATLTAYRAVLARA